MVRGLEKCAGRSSFILIRKNACSRFAYTKQQVAGSNTNIYNRKSTVFGPDGLSLAWARFWKSGDLEIQKFGVQKLTKIKNLKIQIRSAQNVRKVRISRKKSSRPHLGPPRAIFPMDRTKSKNAYLSPIFLGAPMGPTIIGLGSCAGVID